MKVSVQWLNERAGLSLDAQTMSDQLTMAGLEVDQLLPAAGDFSDVVVGEITEARPHPDADKLQVCSVDAGQDAALQIVCGAANARAGIKVAVALVGAVLPGDFRIKPVKLRGVDSAGMICSASELGMAESSEGILELPSSLSVGESLRQALTLDDHILDIDLTPNRGDCLSVTGLARELAAINGQALPADNITTVDTSIAAQIAVELSAPADCPRYLARVLEGVDARAPTPLWMVERLRRSGIRAVNAVVDVANYVMIELGQPLHTFDRNQLGECIVVRRAADKERAKLLDGREITLADDVLLIADEHKALAVAGIMGGEDCGVTSETTDVVIESAFFAPGVINGRARRMGLHTDASHRFERGVDPALAELAMQRATALILEIAGGQAGPVVAAESEAHLPKREEIAFRPQRCCDLLGMQIEAERMRSVLGALGMSVSDTSGAQWRVQPPSSRFDLSIEEDLIEDVARIVGYNSIPTRRPGGELISPVAPEETLSPRILGATLESIGYQEIISYSFVSAEQHNALGLSEGAVALANPLTAELAVMRTSLLPGLLSAFGHNRRRQLQDLRLYEHGLCFRNRDGQLNQTHQLAGILGGKRHAPSWAWSSDALDFFDAKGDVERLLASTGDSSRFGFRAMVDGSAQWLHPGQSAEVFADGKVIGWLGALHPSVLEEHDLVGPVYAFELGLEALATRRLPRFTPVSRFPSVTRDLAVLVDQAVSAQQVSDCVADSAGELLQGLNLFDVYTDARLGDNQKSLGLALVLGRFDKTLTDDDAEAVVSRVKSALKKHLGAAFRE